MSVYTDFVNHTIKSISTKINLYDFSIIVMI